jgi:hypothetical protein
MRQVRHAAQIQEIRAVKLSAFPVGPGAGALVSAQPAPDPKRDEDQRPAMRSAGRRVLQRRAWQWVLANRRSDGSLPSGAEVAREFRRCERWGRLVKKTGLAGQLDAAA